MVDNRRRMRALGKKVPPDSMSPKICACLYHSYIHIVFWFKSVLVEGKL